MKEKIILIVAIFSGLAAMFLTKLYVNKVDADLRSRYQMVTVVVAAQQMNEGTILTDDVVRKSLAANDVSKSAVTGRNILPENIPLIKGRALKNSVQARAPLMWSDIEGGGQQGGNVATMVNESERALSIPVDAIASVTGLVEPNDHVDILGTFTFPSMKGDPQLDTVTLTILQNVTILATGKDTARNRNFYDTAQGVKKGGSYSSVTLLVTPKEAEMLVFAMQKGRLTLDLRNPSDVSSARDLTNINFSYLEKKVSEFNDARQDRLKSGVSH
jgi:pilus assembly protein CpaB